MKEKKEQEIAAVNDDSSDEVDLIEIVKKIWAERKLVCIWCAVGIVLGLIVAFSIPREYTTSVKLAPETAEEKGGSRNLGALAAMAGVSLGSGADAVSPQLYPDIVKSVPFAVNLLEIPVTDKEGKRTITLENYLLNDTKSPWWGVIFSAPRKLIGLLRPAEKEGTSAGNGNGRGNPIRLTEDQNRLIESLNGKVSATVDAKTSVVTITVTMQDPVVSAIVADSVANRLKEYVIDYRTNKARQDMLYIAKLNQEAKEAYYAAQQKYASYLDSHQGLVLYSAQTMRDRLENEATLAFNVFNQTSQQLQVAKAKVQEQTPVYATIEPATVPNTPSAPSKAIILVGFLFLSFAGAVAWIIFARPLIKKFKEDPAKATKSQETEKRDL